MVGIHMREVSLAAKWIYVIGENNIEEDEEERKKERRKERPKASKRVTKLNEMNKTNIPKGSW